MARGMSDDGSFTNLPWASVFDPAANARALSAIQAEGFRAASRLVDRFVGRAAGNSNGVNGNSVNGNSADPAARATAVPPANGTSENRSENLDFEQLMKTWWLIAGQFLVGSARMASAPFIGPASGSPASLDLGNAAGEGVLELQAESQGRATGEVWLHNRSPDDLGQLVLRCSDLLAHDGCVVEAAAVRFEPKVVPVPRRSSRGVEISIGLPPRVRPGVYRGTLLASGKPDLWLPVVLTVRLPGS